MIETRVVQSRFLKENVKVKIAVPNGQPIKKVLILLHGKKESDKDETILDKMIEQLELEALCGKYHLMTVIPCMKNCYYISSEKYNCEKFISEELLELIGKHTNSLLHAEKLLGGISMGGYGAALIGANTQSFQRVMVVSGSFIEKDILLGNPEVWGSKRPTEESTKGSFLKYFLPLSELPDSCYKSAEAALCAIKQRTHRPELYFSCGSGDWLYTRNLRVLNMLRNHQIPYTFFEISEGKHDSRCFREGLWKIFEEIEGVRG